jgi:hypothetical protein
MVFLGSRLYFRQQVRRHKALGCNLGFHAFQGSIAGRIIKEPMISMRSRKGISLRWVGNPWISRTPLCETGLLGAEGATVRKCTVRASFRRRLSRSSRSPPTKSPEVLAEIAGNHRGQVEFAGFRPALTPCPNRPCSPRPRPSKSWRRGSHWLRCRRVASVLGVVWVSSSRAVLDAKHISRVRPI